MVEWVDDLVVPVPSKMNNKVKWIWGQPKVFPLESANDNETYSSSPLVSWVCPPCPELEKETITESLSQSFCLDLDAETRLTSGRTTNR